MTLTTLYPGFLQSPTGKELWGMQKRLLANISLQDTPPLRGATIANHTLFALL